MSAIMNAKAPMNPLDKVGPKSVFIRFSGFLEDPDTGSENVELEYRALVRQVLALMNVDRNAITYSGKRRRVDIAYLPEAQMVEFAFYYSRPSWARRAESVAKVLERLHSNCTVSLEPLKDE